MLKWEVFKVTAAVEESAFYSGRAKWEVFKVTVAMEESAFYSGRAEVGSLQSYEERVHNFIRSLQHMELFVGEFFLRSLWYCITIDFYSTTSTTAGFTA